MMRHVGFHLFKNENNQKTKRRQKLQNDFNKTETKGTKRFVFWAATRNDVSSIIPSVEKRKLKKKTGAKAAKCFVVWRQGQVITRHAHV